MKFYNHKKILINLLVGCFALIIASSGCKKMNDTYAKYVGDGEIVYIHKADSLKLYSGKNRVKLSWTSGIDARVKRAVIYWNNKADSLVYNLTAYPNSNPISVIVPDLPEGSYNFEIFTHDDKGNKSVKADISGAVYGDNYSASLVNRRVKEAVAQNGQVMVKWYDASPGALSTEVSYSDNQNVTRQVMIPVSEKQSVLSNYKSGSELSIRTHFLPQPNAIDTFITALSTIIPEPPLDQLVKSKFVRWNPAGFPYTEYNLGTNAYNIERLWDNVYTGFGFMFNETQPLPSSFTFDMGQLATLKRLTLSPNWDSQLYKNGNVKRFQLWGSATPNVSTDFSTWIFLGEFSSFKPSGLPLGQTTTADLDYAKAGETFDITANAPSVRYIRVVVQETWNPANFKTMHITELTFWGRIK